MLNFEMLSYDCVARRAVFIYAIFLIALVKLEMFHLKLKFRNEFLLKSSENIQRKRVGMTDLFRKNQSVTLNKLPESHTVISSFSKEEIQ